MMDAMPCITCQQSLRDYGKITPDWQWAYCTICGARYEVIPALDEYGQPIKASNGHNTFYLNPVAPGDKRLYREPEGMPEETSEQVPTDFENLKTVIRRTNTVTDFIKSIQTL